jgi:hypothetical protein
MRKAAQLPSIPHSSGQAAGAGAGLDRLTIYEKRYYRDMSINTTHFLSGDKLFLILSSCWTSNGNLYAFHQMIIIT